MQLIIFLALIVNSALFAAACDLGIPTLNNFEYNKVGISVLRCVLKPSAIKNSASLYISFFVQLPICLSTECIRLYD